MQKSMLTAAVRECVVVDQGSLTNMLDQCRPEEVLTVGLPAHIVHVSSNRALGPAGPEEHEAVGRAYAARSGQPYMSASWRWYAQSSRRVFVCLRGAGRFEAGSGIVRWF